MIIAMLNDTQVAQTSTTVIAQTTADNSLPLLLADPTTEVVLALLFLVTVIGVHGICLGQISKFFSSRFVHLTPQSPRWRAGALTSITIALIITLHFTETHIWAGMLFEINMIDNYREAYYYVIGAYTTLGEGAAYLPNGYRFVSPLIALTGLFTFGWSGSVLVYIVGQTGRLHAERSKAETLAQ